MIVTCPNCGKSAKFMPWTSPEGKVLPAAMCLTSGAWLVMTLPQLWQDALELLDMYGLHPYMAIASPYNGIDFFVGSENDPKRIQIFTRNSVFLREQFCSIELTELNSRVLQFKALTLGHTATVF